VADSIPLTCVPVSSARNSYFLRTERFGSGVHAEGRAFWLGCRNEEATTLLDVAKETKGHAVPVQFVPRDSSENDGVFNLKVDGSWVVVSEHHGPYHERGYKAQRWLSPQGVSQTDALPVKVVAAIKSMGFQETYEDLQDQVGGSSNSTPWVCADVLHPLARKTIRLLSMLHGEKKWIGPTDTRSTLRAVYDIKNVVADSIPLTCVPVPSEQDTYYFRTERFGGGVHAEGGTFWLGIRQEGGTSLLDAGKKTQAEAVPVQLAAHEASKDGAVISMKIGDAWVGACEHGGPYREYGYPAQHWLSPMHANKGDAMPIKLIMAIAPETFVESADDFRGSEPDQLDDKYFAAAA